MPRRLFAGRHVQDKIEKFIGILVLTLLRPWMMQWMVSAASVQDVVVGVLGGRWVSSLVGNPNAPVGNPIRLWVIQSQLTASIRSDALWAS